MGKEGYLTIGAVITGRQLDLSLPMLRMTDAGFACEDGVDARNYGDPTGIPEAKRLFGALLGMPPEQVAHLLDEPAEGAEKAEKFRHVGLWNVNRRIRYSFGEGYGLTIESEEDVGTEVTIRLPYQQKGDTHAADITGG